MNLTQLTNILSDKEQKQLLLELIKRKIEIQQSIDSYADDLDDIKKNAESMGLKQLSLIVLLKTSLIKKLHLTTWHT